MIEKLPRGSLLNHRSFFLEEQAQVYARAAKTSIILEMSMLELNSLLPQSELLEKKFLSFQMKIFSSGKTFPVDYYQHVPMKYVIDPLFTTPEKIKRIA